MKGIIVFKKKILFFKIGITTLLLLLIVLLHIYPGCKDPGEYEPEVDSLIDPPEPVRLIYPPDDTGYVKTTAQPILEIDFIWNAIIDAEYYEFQMSSESTFNDSYTTTYTMAYNTLNITGISTGNHFWRVRASSPCWTWFTDWSEIRFFRVWQVRFRLKQFFNILNN